MFSQIVLAYLTTTRSLLSQPNLYPTNSSIFFMVDSSIFARTQTTIDTKYNRLLFFFFHCGNGYEDSVTNAIRFFLIIKKEEERQVEDVISCGFCVGTRT